MKKVFLLYIFCCCAFVASTQNITLSLVKDTTILRDIKSFASLTKDCEKSVARMGIGNKSYPVYVNKTQSKYFYLIYSRKKGFVAITLTDDILSSTDK